MTLKQKIILGAVFIPPAIGFYVAAIWHLFEMAVGSVLQGIIQSMMQGPHL